MSTLKKLGIALLVLIVVLGIFAFVVTRGDTAELPMDEVTGLDPTLDEPDAETFPTVAIADPVGWAQGEAPDAAEGLSVNRFAEGLDHPELSTRFQTGTSSFRSPVRPAKAAAALRAGSPRS